MEINKTLEEVIEDIKKVREQSNHGKTTKEIAEYLTMSYEYVEIILMNMEGYAEDSDKAVAHLVMLG